MAVSKGQGEQKNSSLATKGKKMEDYKREELEELEKEYNAIQQSEEMESYLYGRKLDRYGFSPYELYR